MSIWLAQYCCENNHCLVSALFDDSGAKAARRARLVLLEELARRADPHCTLCGAQPHYKEQRTLFTSFEAAARVLTNPATRKRGDVDLLEYMNSRCTDAEWLVASKRENNVPDDWIWGRCDHCQKIVWYDPSGPATVRALGKAAFVICSAECALALVQAHP